MSDSNYKKQGRDCAIDYLKVLAVFFVMNSHMELCYPKYAFLATGGAIGDALFFFASGFTLFLGRRMRFDNWYKRRLNRIYPTIFAAAIIAAILWNFSEYFTDVLIGKRYWFIGCILVYYVFLYPIKEYKDGKFAKPALFITGIIVVIIYFLFFNDGKSFYGDGKFRYFAFFLIMLQGAIMGKTPHSFKNEYVLFLIVSIIGFYTLFYLGMGNWTILLSFPFLMGITRYSYLCCSMPLLSKKYEGIIWGNIVFILSQLCLEVYLIQKFVFTDRLNYIFPLNIPIIMLSVIIIAYLTKSIAEFISQTFKTEPYDWSKMILKK